jgi:hypothetical protein
MKRQLLMIRISLFRTWKGERKDKRQKTKDKRQKTKDKRKPFWLSVVCNFAFDIT